MVYDRYTEKAIDKYINKFERKKKELEIHETRPALIKLRNSIIASQKKHNYNMEYERLIGILSNKTITHSANKAQLEGRMKNLEHLGSTAVTGIDPRKRQTYEEIKAELGKK